MNTIPLLQIKHFLALAAILLPFSNSWAQAIRVNERGERVIVYADGTQQYFTNFALPADALFDPKDSPDYVPLDSTRYPIFNGTIAPMNNPLAFTTEEDARKIINRRAQISYDAAQIAEKRAQEAALQRSKIEKELQNAEQKGEAEEVIRHLKIRLSAAQKTEQETILEATQAVQEANKANQLTQKGNFLQTLVDAEKNRSKATGTSASLTEQLAEDFYTNLVTTADPAFLNNYSLPKRQCEVAFEGKDETTGQWRRDMQQQLLFSYTDERLRPYLKEKEYLQCAGFLTSTAGFRFLSLQFTFAYPNAQEAYGFIEKGSILVVKLLNGDFVTLLSGRMDQGSYDTESELLNYQVHYVIDRSQLNILKNSEVDSILVFWSTGYEEYQVYQLDFFINQINCLEK